MTACTRVSSNAPTVPYAKHVKVCQISKIYDMSSNAKYFIRYCYVPKIYVVKSYEFPGYGGLDQMI